MNSLTDVAMGMMIHIGPPDAEVPEHGFGRSIFVVPQAALAARLARDTRVHVVRAGIAPEAGEAVLHRWSLGQFDGFVPPSALLKSRFPALQPLEGEQVPLLTPARLIARIGGVEPPMRLVIRDAGREFAILQAWEAAGLLEDVAQLDLRLAGPELFEGAVPEAEVEAWLIARGFRVALRDRDDPDWTGLILRAEPLTRSLAQAEARLAELDAALTAARAQTEAQRKAREAAERKRDAVQADLGLALRMQGVVQTDLRDLQARMADAGALPRPGAVAGSADVQTGGPLRSIHHFACTGGTLIARALNALPNTVVLSEMDPLSEIIPQTTARMPFLPTDLVFALRKGLRPVDSAIVIDSFAAGVEAARAGLERMGQHLILRDHAHSQFCRDDVDYTARPTLREMLVARSEVVSVVTVRHPLDSFLAVQAKGWGSFDPFTLDTYAARYLAFLDRHAGLPIVHYEAFVAAPETVLKQLAGLLGLGDSPVAFDLMSAIRLSGDSGRNEGAIAPRPRRPVPEAVDDARFKSPIYLRLCLQLDYEP